MKKIFTFFIALVASVSAIYASDIKVGGIWYDFNSSTKTASVTYRGYDYDSYDGEYSGSVIIPETVIYNGTTYSVAIIGDRAFYNCSSLTSVTIPNSVTSIGDYAFYKCSSLTSVTIGESVKSIKESAFRNCSSLTSVTIPNSVTSIGDNAFDECSSLTSVTIPNSVTSIGGAAFWGCSKLTSITIPNSVTSIEGYTFSKCSSLTSVTIPNSVTSIGVNAFYSCSKLTSVTIGNGVTSIGDNAFEGCSSLTSVTIPNSVKSIGEYTFYGCSKLTSVTIGESVTSIGDYAFYRCSSLTSVTINSDAIVSKNYSSDSNISHMFGVRVKEYIIGESVKSIGDYAFEGCSSLTTVTIGESVTSIGDDAFQGCSSLTSMTIPNSVISIGDSAFSNCSKLTSVTIGESVTSIGDDAFYGCIFGKDNFVNHSLLDANANNYWGAKIVDQELDGLFIRNDTVIGCRPHITSAVIPDYITCIGSRAFYGCSKLTSATIGESVTSIGKEAFYGCSSLTSVTINSDAIVSEDYEYDSNISHIFGSQVTEYIIGGSVTSIGNRAFYGCSKLTSVTIGESVTSIGFAAFRGCSSLTFVTIPDSVTRIEEYTFYECSSLTSLTIGESVTSIGDYAFYRCSSLTSLTIGESVTSIGDYAFYRCFSLTSLTIGDSVTRIEEYAFYRCSSLTSVTIGESVTNIGFSAFEGCSSLTSLTIPNNVKILGEHAFSGCSKLTSVTLTANSVEEFCQGIGNSLLHKEGLSCDRKIQIDGNDVVEIAIPDSVTNIGDYAFYNCSSLTSVTIPNSVISSGDSAFASCSSLTSVTIDSDAIVSKKYSSDSNISHIFGSQVTEYIIGESVTSIGVCAFHSCSSLTSLTIGESVTSIGDYAFYECSSLTSVTIGNGVTSIGGAAFCACNSLTSITIPNSVTSIGGDAFSGCSSLTSATIGESVTSIGHSAFWGCSKLTSVTIPDSVTSIGDYAFYECSSLTSVTIGNGVKGIRRWAFSYCSSLTSVTIGNGVKGIGGAAFYECSSLTSVTIPNSVISIGETAFSNCSSLTSISIGDSVTSIEYYAFYNCSSLTSVTIPNSVTSIGAYAFSDCSSLTSATIGESVTSIGQDAFYKCSNLTSVVCKAADVPNTEVSAFDSTLYDTLYVPKASLDKYKSTKPWKYFAHILPIEAGDLEATEMCLNSANERAVFFQGEEFRTSAHVYMWDPANDNKELVGSWPGSAATHLGDGNFKFVIPTSVTGDPSTWMIIWNNGIGTKTKDLTFTMHGLYNMSGVQSVITTLCDGGEIPVDPKPEDPNPEDPQDSVMCLNSADERAVFFQGEEFGTSAHVYMWDPANDNKELVGSWPGSAATHLGDGNFKFVIPTSVTGDPSTWMIIWNNGIGGTKTKDLTFTMHGLYNMSGVQSVITTLCDGGEIPVDPKPEDPNPEDPQDSVMCLNSADERAVFFQGEEFGTSAHVYMWDPANDNKELVGSWPGSAATHLGDGNFKFVIPTSVTGDPSTWMIIWNNGIGGTQTENLTFTMHGLYNMSGVHSVVTTLCDGSNTDDPNEEVITCAEAVSICQQTGTTATTKEYTIRGYVTKIEAVYSEQYDNITFWMADTSPMEMDNSSNSVTSLSDYPNIALGKSTTASSSEDSGTLPEYINDGNFNTRWSSEWQDNEYITIDLEQYSFIDHITLHWETAYASQFAILITDEQPSSSTLSSPLPSSATYYQSSGDVQTIPVAKSGRYITLIGIERATAYGISLYELEAYGMPLLQAYCVKPIQNTDKYVQIGDYVEAVGTLVNYGGTTPEINAGGTYTILTKHEENGSTTSVENTNTTSPMTNCQKIIRNGQLIIIRDGIEYNAVGQEL